jgi:hypothetical protein
VIGLLVLYWYFCGGVLGWNYEQTDVGTADAKSVNGGIDGFDEFDGAISVEGQRQGFFSYLFSDLEKEPESELVDPFKRPLTTETTVRNSLSYLGSSSASSYLYASSLVNAVVLVAIVTLLISLSSIVQKISPALGKMLLKSRHWVNLFVFVGLTYIVGEDLLRNFVPYAVWDGLHFPTLGMFTLTMGCVGGAKGALDLALSIPSTLTGKQKLGAGVSVLGILLSFPVAVEALLRTHDMPSNLMWLPFWTARWRSVGTSVYLVGSCLLFFGGFNSFGRSLMGWLRFSPTICAVSYFPVRVLRSVLDLFQITVVTCTKKAALCYSIVIPIAVVVCYVRLTPNVLVCITQNAGNLDVGSRTAWDCTYAMYYFAAGLTVIAWCLGWTGVLMQEEDSAMRDKIFKIFGRHLHTGDYVRMMRLAVSAHFLSGTLGLLCTAWSCSWKNGAVMAVLVVLVLPLTLQEFALQCEFSPLSGVFDGTVVRALKWLITFVRWALKWLITFVRWAWASIVVPLFQGGTRMLKVLAKVVKWIWASTVVPLFQGGKLIVTSCTKIVKWIWASIAVPLFQGGKLIVVTCTTKAWHGIVLPAVNLTISVVKNMVAMMRATKEASYNYLFLPLISFIKFFVRTLLKGGSTNPRTPS